MKNKTINHISINNLFWGYIQKHLVAFGNDAIPKNIHFTISFNENSSDINFHITKNVPGSSKLKIKKPKITIACIDKISLEKMLPSLALFFFNRIFKQLDIAKLNRRNPGGLVFISLKNLNQSQLSKSFTNKFKDISKIAGKKLKIKGDIKKRISLLMKDSELKEIMLDNIIEIPPEPTSFEQGLLVARRKSYHLVAINGKWYTIQPNFNPDIILKMILEPNLWNYLIAAVDEAIIKLKTANTYEDVKEFDNPVRLIWNLV